MREGFGKEVGLLPPSGLLDGSEENKRMGELTQMKFLFNALQAARGEVGG